MQLTRILRHLVLPQWWVLRALPPQSLRRVEQAIAASEATHAGELRVVVEADLPLSDLLRGCSAQARAIDLFSQLRVWDTEQNSGVLIYLQLIDHRVEIVADRGIDAKVGQQFWNAVCRRMEAAFRTGDFEGGVLLALVTITEALREHFAASGENANELPNAPLVL
ncbi:MAG: TPM domain-containing protein [Candidatus Accumulibacter sp. UW26]|jgi:uncharacterized membrane protein